MDDDKYKLLSDESDEDLVKKIQKRITDCDSHFADWRKNAREAYDFDIGHQWSEEDKAKLIEDGRPPVVFNRVCRTINAISGLEVQNRQEINYSARSNEDTAASELLTAAAKWARDNCDAEDNESDAFRDCLVSGIGVTETLVSYDLNPDGDIIVDRVDPFEVRIDPCSTKRNFEDARWCARVKYLTKDEVKETWPNCDMSTVSALYGTPSDMDGSEPHNADPDMAYKQGTQVASNKDSVAVTHYQWFEKTPYYRVVNTQTGEEAEFGVDKWEKIRKTPEMLLAMGIDPSFVKGIKQHKRQYWTAILCNDQLLEKSESPTSDFSLKFITGLRDRNNGVWYGVMWLMMDPQRWANKWLSQIQHILNSNAKGGVMVEDGAVASISKFRDEWAKPNSITFVNAGAITQGMIKQVEAPRYPDGVDRLLQYAMNAINDAAGMSAEMLGTANREQAGYLEEARKKAGVTILATFFDALRRYRKAQGRVMAGLIQEYISDERLIRIVGEDGVKEAVPLVFEKDTLRYDIVIDDAPTSTNTKERVFSILSTLVPQLIQMGVPVPPDVIDYMPIPSSLMGKWKDFIKKSDEVPPEQQQMQQIMQELTMVNAKLDTQKKALDNELLTAKVSETGTQAQLNQAKVQQSLAVAADEYAQSKEKMGMAIQAQENKLAMDMQLQNQKLAMEYEKMVADQNRKDMEMMLTNQRKSATRYGDKNNDESDID